MRMSSFLKLDKAFDHIAEGQFRNLSKQVAYDFLSIFGYVTCFVCSMISSSCGAFATILHSLTVSVAAVMSIFELNILILLNKFFFHPYEGANNLALAEVNI